MLVVRIPPKLLRMLATVTRLVRSWKDWKSVPLRERYVANYILPHRACGDGFIWSRILTLMRFFSLLIIARWPCSQGLPTLCFHGQCQLQLWRTRPRSLCYHPGGRCRCLRCLSVPAVELCWEAVIYNLFALSKDFQESTFVAPCPSALVQSPLLFL